MDLEQVKTTLFTIASRHTLPLILGTLGLILLVYGLIASSGLGSSLPAGRQASNGITFDSAQSSSSATLDTVKISIDIEGAVVKPGVYQLAASSRIKDAVSASGGLADAADKDWIAKHMNLASKLSDGMKVYVPHTGESDVGGQSSDSTANIQGGTVGGLININSASANELDSLPGIGMVTANKIIGARPYSSVDDLLSKKIVSSKVFGEIKDKITIN